MRIFRYCIESVYQMKNIEKLKLEKYEKHLVIINSPKYVLLIEIYQCIYLILVIL